MRRTPLAILLVGVMLCSASGHPSAQNAVATESERAGCAALLQTRNLTITYAGIATTGDGTAYCYVKGILPPAIQFHAQLPLPAEWNGRFLKWGDGGKDGDLDFADRRLVEGYAVANSNTGHDSGAEPGSSFAYDNRQAEIDFRISRRASDGGRDEDAGESLLWTSSRVLLLRRVLHRRAPGADGGPALSGRFRRYRRRRAGEPLPGHECRAGLAATANVSATSSRGRWRSILTATDGSTAFARWICWLMPFSWLATATTASRMA